MFKQKTPLRYVVTDSRAIEPTKGTAQAAAFDFYAIQNAEIVAGSPVTLGTGIRVEVPAGFVMIVNSRSGHGFNFDVCLANGQGWIDPDYRGEVRVRLTAHGRQSLRVRPGDRIAQFLLVPVLDIAMMRVESLDETERGEGGFGSTGGVSA
jgi:dUTP pyrophosphatase